MTSNTEGRRAQLLIDGQWIDGVDSFSVLDKFTGKSMGICQRASKEQVDKAVAAAKRSFQQVKLEPSARYKVLMKATELIEARKELLAKQGPVIIADSSKDNTWDAYENFRYDRVLAEYRRAHVRFVDFNEEEKYVVQEIVDRHHHLMQVRLAARLFDPDAFILGAALLKAHDNVVATLSVKNLVMLSSCSACIWRFLPRRTSP